MHSGWPTRKKNHTMANGRSECSVTKQVQEANGASLCNGSQTVLHCVQRGVAEELKLVLENKLCNGRPSRQLQLLCKVTAFLLGYGQLPSSCCCLVLDELVIQWFPSSAADSRLGRTNLNGTEG